MSFFKYLLIILSILSNVSLAFAQDLRELIITKSDETQLVVFAQFPSNAALMVRSKVLNLKVESNLGIVADLSDRSTGVLRYILHPGRQTLTFSADGFLSSNIQTDILSARQVLNLDVAPKDIVITEKGGLEITTTPSGANLRIDGIPGSFKSPYIVSDVFAMSYTISVELNHYLPETFRITVNKGEITARHIELRRSTPISSPNNSQLADNNDMVFDVNVKVVPSDADVTINALPGSPSNGGLINFKLKGGRYLINASKEGYKSIEEVFTVNESIPFKLVILDPIEESTSNSLNAPQIAQFSPPSTTRLQYVSCGGSVRDPDGHEYPTASIGIQCWMTENLRTTKYRDGSAIAHSKNSRDWITSKAGLWTTYDNDMSNKSTFGMLYNWHAVNDNRGLCPVGWKIPSESDWESLIKYLGPSPGGNLKSVNTQIWLNPNFNATDTYGFSGMPGGYFNVFESFAMLGKNATWWSSDEISISLAWSRSVYYSQDYVLKDPNSKQLGLAVRCLKGLR